VNIKPGIWIVDISDHLPVLAILPSKSKNCKTKKVVAKQDFSQTNVEKFKNELSILDWSFLDQFPDTESMYNALMHKIQELYKIAFPIRTKSINTATNHRT